MSLKEPIVKTIIHTGTKTVDFVPGTKVSLLFLLKINNIFIRIKIYIKNVHMLSEIIVSKC